MKIIVLAAGQDGILDGMIKCLIRHPEDGKTILEYVVEAADGIPVSVVVGYKAIEIIERYPGLDYVINSEWAVTNNAYSLGLALDETPCIVMPGDIFINRSTILALMAGPENCALVSARENRGIRAISAELNGERISVTYTGQLRDPGDMELLGLFKITSPALLAEWKKNCLAHSNRFCGETLPLATQLPGVQALRIKESCGYDEINTVADYLRLIKACARSRP